MHNTVVGVLLIAGLFIGMLLMLEAGWRTGRRNRLAEGAHPAGAGVVDGAVFGLMGLVVAFTFSGAATRFDQRRQLIVEEANAIGTAWLRLDLVPAPLQPELREKFRQYLDARLAAYAAIPDRVKMNAKMAEATALQGDIWRLAVAATGQFPGTPAAILLVPALNAMFDITTTRTMAMRIHPPVAIFGLLALLALICGALAGYGMSTSETRNWIRLVGFAAILTVTLYVILDLEYPRVGLLRITDFDQVLIDVRATMQ